MDIRRINPDFFQDLYLEAIQERPVQCPVCNGGTAARAFPAADWSLRQIAFEPCKHVVGPNQRRADPEES